MDVKINRKKIRKAIAPVAVPCSRGVVNRAGRMVFGQRQKTAGHPAVSPERDV